MFVQQCYQCLLKALGSYALGLCLYNTDQRWFSRETLTLNHTKVSMEFWQKESIPWQPKQARAIHHVHSAGEKCWSCCPGPCRWATHEALAPCRTITIYIWVWILLLYRPIYHKKCFVPCWQGRFWRVNSWRYKIWPIWPPKTGIVVLWLVMFAYPFLFCWMQCQKEELFYQSLGLLVMHTKLY